MTEFKMNENEEKAYKAFCDKHKHCCQERLGKPFFSTIGGQFTLHVTPTGLGNCWTVECNVCKEVKDITDSDCW